MNGTSTYSGISAMQQNFAPNDVVPVSKADLATLNEWCEAWGKDPFPEGWLPTTGYWVPGLVAAFLYRTDSKLAYIECVISNPKAEKLQRRIALNAVAGKIEEEARKLGFTYLLGWTNNRGVTSIGKRRNYTFSEFDNAVMIKGLK